MVHLTVAKCIKSCTLPILGAGELYFSPDNFKLGQTTLLCKQMAI